MSVRHPRFEVVRTDAGWHGRFRSGNNRIVWTTEVYTREANAWNAIYLLTTSDLKHTRTIDARTDAPA